MLKKIHRRVSEWSALAAVRADSRWNRWREVARQQTGAITIEYILIIALIAIIIITLFTVLLWPLLRPALEDLIDRITSAIAGEGID